MAYSTSPPPLPAPPPMVSTPILTTAGILLAIAMTAFSQILTVEDIPSARALGFGFGMVLPLSLTCLVIAFIFSPRNRRRRAIITVMLVNLGSIYFFCRHMSNHRQEIDLAANVLNLQQQVISDAELLPPTNPNPRTPGEKLNNLLLANAQKNFTVFKRTYDEYNRFIDTGPLSSDTLADPARLKASLGELETMIITMRQLPKFCRQMDEEFINQVDQIGLSPDVLRGFKAGMRESKRGSDDEVRKVIASEVKFLERLRELMRFTQAQAPALEEDMLIFETDEGLQRYEELFEQVVALEAAAEAAREKFEAAREAKARESSKTLQKLVAG